MKRPVLALALAALAACATSDPPDVDLQVGATGFVRTTTNAQGRPRFTVDGKPFRFLGGNLTELPWLDAAAQDHELQWAHDVGFQVIRVWGVDDATGADQMAATLRGLLDRAAAHGLRVTIALTHNYHQPNWLSDAIHHTSTFHAVPGDARPNGVVGEANGFYTRDCGAAAGLWCLDDRWIDWGYTAYYRDYATRLVGLLRDHPAVFSWDIANETSGSSRMPWIVGRVTAFYVEMARLLKAADPNHLITTGMISSSWAGMTDAQRDQVYGSANIDYLTIHEYEHPLDDEHQRDEVWRANNRYHKPIVVEELGVHSAAAAQAYYDSHLRPADASFEVTGIVYWGVASPQLPAATDGTWSPQALGAYDWFVTFWRGWAATLAAEAGTASGPCVALASGAGLGVNQAAASCDGKYTLVMQGDGNLVLYRNGGGAVWASCTQDPHPTAAFMQTDGNLVVYAQAGARWDSHTWGHGGARLVFEPAGLVMRGPDNAVLWTSATFCR